MSGRLLPRRLPLVLVRVGRRFPRSVIVVSLAMWLVAGLLATRISVETDILSLVPQHNRAVENFKNTIERFGTVDTLLVVVRLGPEENREQELAFADQLAARLQSWDLIEWVEYRVENSIEIIQPLLRQAVLFMDPAEVEAVIAGLDDPGLEARAKAVYFDLIAPQGLMTKEAIRADPFGLLPHLLSRVRLGGVEVSADPETGVLIDPDGRMLLMLARPIKAAQDLAFNRKLVSGLGRKVHEAREAWLAEGWEGTPPAVEFTGGYVVTLNDSELIVSDAVLGLGSALVGVMLLFLLAFRRKAALVYAFVPLATGLGLTFAFGVLVLGRMNSLTSAFGGLLVGLGIDFIIVLYGRYVEERQAGADHGAAIDAMARHTGVGVLLGAVTTAATFFAFLATDFRGLTELGLLTGTGILLLAVTVFLLLPALLTTLQHRSRRGELHVIQSFGADRLCALALKRPRIVIIGTVVLTVVFAWGSWDLQFDDDIQNMRSPDNKGMILRTEVMEAFGLRFTPMTVRVDGATEREAIAAARSLLPELEALVDGENLADVDTIVDLFPDFEDQESVLEILRRHPEAATDLRARLSRELRRAGLNPAPFVPGIENFEKALALRSVLALDDLEGTLLERMARRYVAEFDGGVSVAIRCYPPAGRWRREAPPALEALVDLHPEAILTGPNVVSAELRRIVWGDAFRASAIGIVLVFLLMWADFGSPGRSALALLPLVLGMIWMLGVMSFLGIRINFMNIFVITMVIGIGVDYSVHFLHRWFETDGNPEALAGISKAIAVAALTTVVGFGSLVLSHYPGLRSVGFAAILGALATAFISITVLPVILSWRGGR
ncbi:MAG: MMPL family transporter [Acidobacteria bacterium]|nr:MMPL family transporter [Acidobacteriota bacterium]